MIANEELKIGDFLPSVRSLAKSLEISAFSVQRAYAELQKEGVIESAEGKGNFVAEKVNKSSLKDTLLREVEHDLKKTIQLAQKNGVEFEEFQNLSKILWEESNE